MDRDFADYAAMLRRHWAVVVCCLIAGLAVGTGALLATPAEYVATAQVQVLPTGVQDQPNQVTARQREPLNLDTEAQIAQSSVVADKAAELLKNPDPEGLRKRVGVAVPPNSAILSISFSASDSAAAAAGAEAFADAYLKNREEAATQAIGDDLKALRDWLHDVDTSLAKAAAGVIAAPRGTAARALATHQQSVLAKRSYSLTLKYDGLRAIAVSPGTVISPARPPLQPAAPSLPVYVGGGLFAGLVLGAAAAQLRDPRQTPDTRPGPDQPRDRRSMLGTDTGTDQARDRRSTSGTDTAEDRRSLFGNDAERARDRRSLLGNDAGIIRDRRT